MLSSKGFSIQDKAYFEGFFNSHYQTLCYFAYSYLNDREMAEDIVQNIFVNLFNNPDNKFDDEQHFKFFLYKSIKNACINELKKISMQANTLNDLSLDTTDESDFDIFQSIVRTEVYKEILDAVNQLPERCGEIFKLAYIEQMTNNEIAKLLSISVNTVKAQKNNAKKLLREHLKHLYPIVVFLFFIQ